MMSRNPDSLLVRERLLCITHYIFKTEVRLVNKIVEPRHYIHTKLKKQLLKIAPKYLKNLFLVNIDGLPLFKSLRSETYFILCSVVSISKIRKVFPVGIYYDTEKPNNLNEYLQDFIDEINNLIEHGLHFGNHTSFLNGTYFICDAPAKSYVMGTISQPGFNSCTRCIVRGVTSDNRIFVDLERLSHSNEGFLEWKDTNFRRDTPLTNIAGLDFIHHFILDYLHLQCLGVMQTMIMNI